MSSLLWLGISLIVLVTGIFIFFSKRLYSRRYCHKTFLHSFSLLFISYLACYTEAIVGLVISCILFANEDDMSDGLIYFGTILLLYTSSTTFSIRILRQYRIHLLTYIEKGLLSHRTIVERKSRLTRWWNYRLGLTYLAVYLSLLIPMILLHRKITDMVYYGYLTYLIVGLRCLENLIELAGFIVFMNKNILLVYRVESFILLCVSILNTSIILTIGIQMYLTYSVVTMLKVSYVIYNDAYVFCYLLSSAERKPLLPPICMINSSFFAPEIKLVYDIFFEFLQDAKNSDWIFLLEFLMEIRMLKFENSHLLKDTLKTYLGRVKDEHPKLWNIIKLCENESFEDQLIRYQTEIIKALDDEAFACFMSSPFFRKLEKKFNEIRLSSVPL